MKVPALFGGAIALATLLGGCVVAPLEPAPVVYAAPAAPAVVLRPASRHHTTAITGVIGTTVRAGGSPALFVEKGS
jgi:hypothetical protein